MTKTPRWLPDGSGIDPKSLNGDTVVETLNGFRRARHAVAPIVRVYADVTPTKPDPRVEVVARALAAECGSDTWQADEKWMRWLIEQLHYGIDTSCEVDPPCTLADYAAMWERIDPREKHMAEVIVAETGAWADELTDTDDRSK